MFKIFSASLRKADEKAKLAIYTSDMDTDKEARCYRKIRAKKFVSSSESEEEPCTDVILPFAPCPPKRPRLYGTNESSYITCSGDSAIRNGESQEMRNSSSRSFLQDLDNHNISYARNEEAHNSAVYPKEKNRENISNRHVDNMEEIGRSYTQDKERRTEKKDDNHQSSQDAI
ncbi:PREDICTED: uncharacterized protein LOC105564789, partial [Vollenhovia emeryi]|uniref:uncharacterized protein LOC105564789 n=1 Tax=Vollenhovia emeryi TaxID=411798 RepID=UPI0005F43F17